MLHKDPIIVGNGIASHVMLYYLSLKLLDCESRANLPTKMLVLDSPKAKTCSLYTTSHAGTINARDGISPLGDMIKQSYMRLCHFTEEKKPSGIYRGQLYKSYDISDEVRPELVKTELALPKNLKSNEIFYGHQATHHFIDPENFLNWLKKEYLKNFKKLSINIIFQDLHINNVTYDSVHQEYALEADAEILKSSCVLLTTGIELFKLWNKDKWSYPKLNSRDGDYLYINNVDFGEESFSIMIESTNVVYRHFSKQLLLGGTTNHPGEYTETPNHDELQFFHREFKKYAPELPDYDQFTIERGARVRGPKRYPFAGELHPGLYGMLGLYKNGFTFPFLMAPDLANLMIQKYFLKRES